MPQRAWPQAILRDPPRTQAIVGVSEERTAVVHDVGVQATPPDIRAIDPSQDPSIPSSNGTCHLLRMPGVKQPRAASAEYLLIALSP